MLSYLRWAWFGMSAAPTRRSKTSSPWMLWEHGTGALLLEKTGLQVLVCSTFHGNMCCLGNVLSSLMATSATAKSGEPGHSRLSRGRPSYGWCVANLHCIQSVALGKEDWFKKREEGSYKFNRGGEEEIAWQLIPTKISSSAQLSKA